MRNLTVRVPDEVYTAARVYAARYNTSLSAVVADFLCTVRNVSLSIQGVSPGMAIDIHRDLLAESAVGRVNIEPFNNRETYSWARAYIQERNRQQ